MCPKVFPKAKQVKLTPMKGQIYHRFSWLGYLMWVEWTGVRGRGREVLVVGCSVKVSGGDYVVMWSQLGRPGPPWVLTLPARAALVWFTGRRAAQWSRDWDIATSQPASQPAIAQSLYNWEHRQLNTQYYYCWLLTFNKLIPSPACISIICVNISTSQHLNIRDINLISSRFSSPRKI